MFCAISDPILFGKVPLLLKTKLIIYSIIFLDKNSSTSVRSFLEIFFETLFREAFILPLYLRIAYTKFSY